MAERDWVLCFEQWRGARFHVRQPEGDGQFGPTFCGMVPNPKGGGRIAFEDELTDAQMCKTCRKRAIAAAEAEAALSEEEK